ncbi:DUF1656 domain-containing protein [Acinetobacter qingfengensis]|uniref:Uncharacterized protein n=1 Tax=Acinetobacter qingfengensis TaxID=1262585 RepID=A0A1E7RFZ4_9GAMM|nr:DUF1656 domain-containing protein [Acinetobacter qingfengensis]KAA8732737.1 DUF1656 domain-containing protein [Acinetobacter qingfengensis]OEY98147.1 hypothetical protein BJI46_01105 [Acinetobacter qingfengensis]
MSEVDFYGLLIPILLIQGILAYILFIVSNRIIDKLHNHGWIMFPNIFYLCWYFVCLLGIHGLFVFLNSTT